jgi:hypothetical protein
VLSAPGVQIPELVSGSNQRVAAGRDGSGAVVWVERDGSEDRVMARMFDPVAGSWGAAQNVAAVTGQIGTSDVRVDTDGNATVVWTPANYSWAKASTRLAGESSWSDPETVGGGGLYAFGLEAAPDGTVVAAYAAPGAGPNPVQVVTRARNSAEWSDPVTVDSDGANPWGMIAIDFNASGDGVMLFVADKAGTNNAYLSRFGAATGAWSETPTVVFGNVTAGFSGMHDVVIAPGGQAAAALAAADFASYARTMRADGSLTPAVELGSGMSVVPKVAVDASGRTIIAWQTLDLVGGQVTSDYVTGDPETGDWSSPEPTPGVGTRGLLGMDSTDNGRVTIVLARARACLR